MHLSRVVPTHPTSGDSRSQGGALVRPVEVFCCCQPLGWCSPPVGVGFAPKQCPRSGGKSSAKWQSPPLTWGVRGGGGGTTIDRCIWQRNYYTHSPNSAVEDSAAKTVLLENLPLWSIPPRHGSWRVNLARQRTWGNVRATTHLSIPVGAQCREEDYRHSPYVRESSRHPFHSY